MTEDLVGALDRFQQALLARTQTELHSTMRAESDRELQEDSQEAPPTCLVCDQQDEVAAEAILDSISLAGLGRSEDGQWLIRFDLDTRTTAAALAASKESGAASHETDREAARSRVEAWVRHHFPASLQDKLRFHEASTPSFHGTTEKREGEDDGHN